ncbi:MAG TPA: transglycosylase family protein [Candidatus Saccharimonadales bacterium]|jgi:hypothetical protein
MELQPGIRRVSRSLGAGVAAGISIFGLMSLPESPLEQRSDQSLISFARPLGILATTQMPTTTTTTTQPMTPAEYAASKVTPLEFKEWSTVNNCEEHGNWHVYGAISGGLGIKEPNWISFGGQLMFGNEANATPDEQIVVAMEIQSNPPDQSGVCVSW